MILHRKRLSLVIAAIVCCGALFAVGLVFGLKDQPNKGPLIEERIRVIPPKYGHAPSPQEGFSYSKPGD
jgi:hypothetical protein